MEKVLRSPRDIGPLIRALRRAQNLTQSQLSELTGIKQQTISAIEGGHQQANMRTFFSILATLSFELLARPRPRRPLGYVPGKEK